MIGGSIDAQQHFRVSLNTVCGIPQAQPQLVIDEAVDRHLSRRAGAQQQRQGLGARGQMVGDGAERQNRAGDAPQAPQHP